jgi:hypothetical protein
MNNKKYQFNELVLSFQDLYKEYINIKKSKIYLQEESNISLLKTEINFSLINNNDLILFYEKLVNFKKLLDTLQNNHILIQGFYDNQYDYLIKIKFFLINLKNNKYRSFHDKIFINIFKMDKHVPLGVTRIFGEFVKGITFFSDQMEHKKSIPIYHRAASCGNSSNDFRKKYLRCYQENQPETIDKKRTHIYRCYLERLIYDDMFIHAFTHVQNNMNKKVSIKQNIGHKFQLTEREHNFNSCFLDIKINIKIEYKNNFPVTLFIYFYNKNGEFIKTEKFEKILLYDDYGNGYYTESAYYTLYDSNGKESVDEFDFYILEE